MIGEQRRLKILDNLKKKDVYSIDDLNRELKVSRVTIQRDIKLLEKNGLVVKVHNGVKLKIENKMHFETRFNVRLNQNYEEKLEIAKKALCFVSEGDTIYLDASTTIYIFAKELLNKTFFDLNVITNSSAILCEGLKNLNIKIISTGGELNKDWHMLTGRWAIDFLEKVNIDKAFISAAGISYDKSITTSSSELENILSIVCKKTKEINLLVDSTKFTKSGMINICNVKDFKRIITNSNTDSQVILDFKKIKGPEIIF